MGFCRNHQRYASIVVLISCFFCCWRNLLPLVHAAQIVGLKSSVWKSQVTIHYENGFGIDRYPFICNYENVFVDVTTVYFIAHESQKYQGMLDLYECCNLNKVGRQCSSESSVHSALCACNYDFRGLQFAAVATREHLQFLQSNSSQAAGKRSHYLTGTTWLMHHHDQKHLAHFAAKLLQFRAMMANRNLTDHCCYSDAPAHVDRLVSMDARLLPLSDYEATILQIVWTSVGKEYEFFSLRDEVPRDVVGKMYEAHSYSLDKRQYFCSYCEHLADWMEKSKFPLSVRDMMVLKDLQGHCKILGEELKQAVRFPIWFSEKVSLTPNNDQAFLPPRELSFTTFQQAVATYVANHSKKHLQIFSNDEDELTVAVLQRSDGSGLRKILNLDDVVRLVKSTLEVKDIQLWFIDGNMTALKQIAHFHSFDVLLSTHSSQLFNLIFARKDAHVIEILPDFSHETSFLNLAASAGLDYYQVMKGHKFNRNGYGSADWRLWDYYVNLSELQLALESIKEKIKQEKGKNIGF